MITLSKNLIGNNFLINNLFKSYKSNSLPNSFIFSGQKGVGKSTAAFFLINKIYQSLNTKNVNNESLIYNNSHPNIRYVNKRYDEKTNKLKKDILIEQIRSLENFLNQSSFDNLPKFIIIDSADDFNISSANSLLKSLEEPKKNTFFILIAHQISSLLPTIRSRCINYSIKKPNYEDFSQILLNNNSIPFNEINLLYNVTNSSPGLAIEIYLNNIKDIFSNILKIFTDNNSLSPNLINLVNEVGLYSNQDFKNFLILLRFILLSTLKIKLGYSFKDTLDSDIISNLSNIVKYISNSTLLSILEFINENERDLFIYNLDKKIFCFNIFKSLKNNYE